MKLLRTLAWLRWRLLAGTLRAANRGRVEQASRVLQTVLQLVLGLVVGGFSLALATGAVFAGVHVGDPKARLVFGVASGLALTLAMLLAVVFASSSGVGETLASPRLLLLPIRRRTLLALQILAALGDPFVLALLPSLLAFPLAAAVGGAPAVGLVAALAGLGIAGFLAAFSSAATGSLELLLRNRRRREVFLLVAALGLTALSLGPSLVRWRGRTTRPSAADRAQLRVDASTWGARLRLTPPGLYGSAIDAAAERGARAALPALAGIVLSAAAAGAIAAAVYRRLLTSPPTGPRAHGATGAVLRPLPGLERPTAALAAALLRSLLRTTPARTTLVMTPVLALVMSRNVDRLGGFLPAPALAAALLGPLVLVGVGQLLVNQFAFDGNGLARQVLLPVSSQQQVAARRASCLAYLAAAGLPALLVVAVAGPGPAPWLLLASALATAAVARLAVPCALGLAALLPKSVDPSRLGRASQPHQAAALIWLPLVGVLTGPLWTLGALVGSIWGEPAVAAAAAGLFVVSTWIARPLEAAVARLFTARREALLLVAGGR